jgi:hypothetical protein
MFGKFNSSVFLYKEDVDNEKKDRLLGVDYSDYLLIDELIKEINSIGYDFKYLADFRWKRIKDKRAIPILGKYLLRFKNLGIAEDLLNLVSYKGFVEATSLVLDLYKVIQQKYNQKHQCVSCDNALSDIEDNNFTSEYIKFLKSENDVIRLPLTMQMLGKWRNIEAKEHFIQHLNSNNDELILICLNAIKYYKGDEDCKKILTSLSNSKNKIIANLSKKTINKILL